MPLLSAYFDSGHLRLQNGPSLTCLQCVQLPGPCLQAKQIIGINEIIQSECITHEMILFENEGRAKDLLLQSSHLCIQDGKVYILCWLPGKDYSLCSSCSLVSIFYCLGGNWHSVDSYYHQVPNSHLMYTGYHNVAYWFL